MGDHCSAGAGVIHQLHGGCIRLEALRAGADKLKGQASRQTQPGVRDVVSITHVHDLQAASLLQLQLVSDHSQFKPAEGLHVADACKTGWMMACCHGNRILVCDFVPWQHAIT